jgi:serine/threonine protein kinase
VNFSARYLSGHRGTASVDKSIQLGRGATATVHPARLGGYSYAAKIFLEDRPFPTAKILAMLANPPSRLADQGGDGRAGRLAWPVAILSDEKGRDVGFLMPVVDLTSAYPLDYFYDQTLFKKLKSPNEAALSFKLEIARNLSALVADLHDHGHCFIDMKPQNIRVTLNSHEVCLLDCDGFSIAGPSGSKFPAELLSTDYISPEAFRGNTPPSGLGEEQDRYALAVLLFQLLNRGTHPFQGIPVGASVDVATNDEKAARGMYPHGRTPHPSLRPRPHSIHEQFDDGLRALYDQAFVGSPGSRPSAKDWAHKFDQLLTSKALARCDQFPNDVSHMRFRGKLCPACYLAALPEIKVPPSSGPKTPPPRTEVPPAPPPTQRPNPSTKQPPKEPPIGMLLLGFLGLVILAALIGEPNKSEVPTTQPPTEQPTPSTCTATFTSESPQRLCELYWSNQLPVCDPQLRGELERRQLIVVPQATCGQPISITKKNPVEKLSDATVGASEVSRDSSQDDALWVSAVNGTIDRINASNPIQNEADSTILFTGVSIRPFSSLMFWYGSESCALITEAGICTQERNGLLCDRDLFSGQDSRKLCIGSFRR